MIEIPKIDYDKIGGDNIAEDTINALNDAWGNTGTVQQKLASYLKTNYGYALHGMDDGAWFDEAGMILDIVNDE